MKVLLHTTPLGNANAIRGVGMYTKLLQAELEKLPDVELVSTPPADIVHYPFFDLFWVTLPLKLPTPTIVTIHDVIPLLYPDQYPAGVKGKLKFLRQKAALKKVKAVITDSYASKWDIVEHLGVEPEKIEVVSLAANPDLIPPTRDKAARIRERLDLPEKYILYVGDVNYNKNLPQLIKAMKFLPEELKLVCVGKNFVPQEIPEWQAIERQMALSDVSSQIKFIPDIKGEAVEKLAAVYAGAVAYVQPSLAEGFGLPVLEAMQCGTPVVAANNSSLVEVGGSSVIYTGTDAEAIAQAVQAVMGWSQRKRQEWIKAAKDWQQTFSWEKTAQQTKAVYEKYC